MHEKALATVALFHKHAVSCFSCGRTTRPLELDHLRYEPDSVRRGHGAERSEEAMLHPERFRILCRGCHIAIDLKALGETTVLPKCDIGSEVRAEKAFENRLGKRDIKEELLRRENVIQAVQARNQVLDAEAQYYSDQLDEALSDLDDERQAKEDALADLDSERNAKEEAISLAEQLAGGEEPP